MAAQDNSWTEALGGETPAPAAVQLNHLDNVLITLLAKRLARALLLAEDEDGRDTDCETSEFTETL